MINLPLGELNWLQNVFVSNTPMQFILDLILGFAMIVGITISVGMLISTVVKDDFPANFSVFVGIPIAVLGIAHFTNNGHLVTVNDIYQAKPEQVTKVQRVRHSDNYLVTLASGEKLNIKKQNVKISTGDHNQAVYHQYIKRDGVTQTQFKAYQYQKNWGKMPKNYNQVSITLTPSTAGIDTWNFTRQGDHNND